MYLKEFREKIGLSQRDFAIKIGLTQVTITRYETGKINPTTNIILRYIDTFGANPNFLFLGKEPHLLEDIKSSSFEKWCCELDGIKIIIETDNIDDYCERMNLTKLYKIA